MHLLHIVGSPRKSRSRSGAVANLFVQGWQVRYPAGTVDALDVWTTDLPPFDGAALDAKYAGLSGESRTTEQELVWQKITDLGGRFHRADVLLWSVPMWNYGIPYRLKHLIDAVSQKDVLFSFDERGLRGLLDGRKAVVIGARGAALGGDLLPTQDYDFQVAYLRVWCRLVGITDFESILIEKTLFGFEADAASCREAGAKASQLAATI